MTAANLRVVAKVVAIILARAGADDELRGRHVQRFLQEGTTTLPIDLDKCARARGALQRAPAVGARLAFFFTSATSLT